MADERKPRVCHWGALDAGGFGDGLYPLIAHDQLSRRLPDLEMTCFAPTGGAALPPGVPPCFPLTEEGGYLSPGRREYFAGHFDAVLVGGGDLLRFDRVAPGYEGSGEDGPLLRPYHAFLEPFWDGARPAILWNAPGVPFPFERPRYPLVRRACSNVDYLSVRDEASRVRLLEAGVGDPVHLVPDPGVLVADLIRSRPGETSGRGLLQSRGVEPGGKRRLLCFQCSPAECGGGEDLVARTLAGIAEANDLHVVLLPLGPDDGNSLRAIRRAGGDRFVLAEDLSPPLEAAAVIGACDFFAGSSLHGNLAALSFGVPHAVVNTLGLARLEGLVQLAGLEDFRTSDLSDLGSVIEKLVSGPRGHRSEKAERLKTMAADHFDRLAAMISEAAERRDTPGGAAPSAQDAPGGEDLLQAHGAVADLLDRLDDEREASRVTVQRLEADIGDLEEIVRRAGARDGADPERLRRQLAERERTILDLGRELRNLDELRGVLRDRTERLAQREREVELLTHRLAVRNHMTALRVGGTTGSRAPDPERGA